MTRGAALLWQPPAANPLTGGYRYNAAVATGAVQLVEWPALAAAPATLAADVLVLDSLWLRTPELVGAARARWPGVRVAWLVHGLPSAFDHDEPAPRAAELAALAAADLLVLPGDALGSALAAGGVATPRVIVPPGVDPALRRVPSAPAAGAPCLLSVGTVTPVKGHDRLAAALARLGHLAWRWRVVGAVADPAARAALDAPLVAAGLEARVQLVGPRPPEAMADELAQATLCVQGSRSENAPLWAREALAAGRPVVAPRVGDLAALVEATGAGVLAGAGEPDDLAAALAGLLGDPARLAACTRAARLVGAALPDWSQVSRDFAAALTRASVAV